MAEKMELDYEATPIANNAQAVTSEPTALDRPKTTVHQDVARAADSVIGSNIASSRREMLEGTENLGTLVQNRTFDEGLGFGNDAMLGAIEQRGQRQLSRGMRRFKHESNMDTYQRRAEKISAASQMVSKELENNMKADAIARARRAAKKRARGSVVGNVLGIVGAVAGGFYGGPAGASAGYALGQGVGNQVGSQ